MKATMGTLASAYYAVAAALAHDAQKFSTASSTDQTWTHTPVGVPAGVIVLCISFNDTTTNRISAVDYGGVALTQVALSPFSYAMGGEFDGVIFVWFKGSGLPAGAQTVSATIASDAGTFVRCASFTVVGPGNTQILDTTTYDSGAATDATPAATVTVAGSVDAQCYGVLMSGNDDVSSLAAGSGFTQAGTYDFGAECGSWIYANATVTTNTSVNWTQTAEQAAVFAVAIGNA